MKVILLGILKKMIKIIVKTNNLMFDLVNPLVEKIEDAIYERSIVLFDIELSEAKKTKRLYFRKKSKTSKKFEIKKTRSKKSKRITLKKFNRRKRVTTARNVYRE